MHTNSGTPHEYTSTHTTNKKTKFLLQQKTNERKVPVWEQYWDEIATLGKKKKLYAVKKKLNAN